MPLQNRVTPFGEIVADPARGGMMGNRGILHDENRRLGASRWRHKNWIICLLSFRDRHEVVMAPRHYTQLFFLDEAVALAAGHRPCAECRRPAYRSFVEAISRAGSGQAESGGARSLDALLHRARVDPRSRRQLRRRARLERLPDGTFVTLDQQPHRAYLVLGERLFPWSAAGYQAPLARPDDTAVEVLTPAPTVAALGAGYRPFLHPSLAPWQPREAGWSLLAVATTGG